ncbi:TonB-dependent receptor [Shewanella sp. VB17]|uniref:TonB-dependent receptor n=1 Tax=Shewanella sp. VB17 TaxID=2739432 RepID=UPI0015630CD8|nr:TonB-dependent receptor [Shewanella sp. VB17]NRD74613.1 TonB-dependent receptor [Shewanella sp. VB17]
MHKSHLIAKSIRIALIGGVTAATFAAPVVVAAETGIAEVERITVTGSAIKRTDLEGALPITVISRADIDRSGVTNTAELVQQLPSMQGFTTSSDSVGGDGGGTQTASIHNLGEEYTLVLINGRRLAPADSGSSIDVSSIPISAIERVEVLTDGASALYGSDAIAGVVNFIMKENFQGFSVNARYDKPEEDGGSGYDVGFTTGFGDIDTDGFNVMLSYSHNDREQLKATDRDYASSGIIPFNNNDRDLYFFNGSPNAIPANARVRYDTGVVDPVTGDNVINSRTFNPYAAENVNCAVNNSAIGEECFFDYTTTIEIVPESVRDSVFLSGQVELTDDLRLFADASVSKFKMTTRIAPYPTGYFNLPSQGSSLVNNYVVPYLTAPERAAYDTGDLDVQARWRALPAGNRTTEWDTLSTQLVAGLEGGFGDFEYSGALTYSSNDSDENYPSGWLLREPFVEAVSAGNINVFVPNSEFDDASQAALESTIFSGNWESTKVEVTGVDFRGSMPVFSMSGGDAYIAAGFDYRQTQYTSTLSEAQQNAAILFLSAGSPYDLERDNYGVFTEISLPIIDDLEVTGSLRYDGISGVDDNLFGEKLSGDLNDTTYKISARYQATESLLLRASYGTGFKAPSMLQIGQSRAEFGVTGGKYSCPFPSSDPLAQYCLTGASQYSIFREGDADLKPETSTQYTVGFMFAPSSDFSFGLDYWNVEMEDVVTRLTESQIFADPVLYRDLFTTKTNLATNEEELAIIQAAVNVGKTSNSGIDWTTVLINDLGWGELYTNFSGTYMIESDRSVPGSPDEMTNSMGRFGDDNGVTFRVIAKISATLTHDDFAHTVTANYKSGYQDQFQSADDCAVTKVDAFGDCVDVQLNVPSYTKIDYQSKYFVIDNMSITFGINNLFDVEPSLSLRTGGAGHQVGFDPRYADAYGRTYYLQGDYTF